MVEIQAWNIDTSLLVPHGLLYLFHLLIVWQNIKSKHKRQEIGSACCTWTRRNFCVKHQALDSGLSLWKVQKIRLWKGEECWNLWHINTTRILIQPHKITPFQDTHLQRYKGCSNFWQRLWPFGRIFRLIQHLNSHNSGLRPPGLRMEYNCQIGHLR